VTIPVEADTVTYSLRVEPIEPMDDQQAEAYRGRIQGYMQKALREAKLHTSWMNPSAAYEQTVTQFVDGLLQGEAAAPFAHGEVCPDGLAPSRLSMPSRFCHPVDFRRPVVS
jgi:hypothetical protein